MLNVLLAVLRHRVRGYKNSMTIIVSRMKLSLICMYGSYQGYVIPVSAITESSAISMQVLLSVQHGRIIDYIVTL